MKKNSFPFSGGVIASGLALALLSPMAGAAGLNEITVYSALGQPLNAEVQVTATAAEIPGMSARLASPEVFADKGMSYAISLRQLRFKVEKRGKGAVVKITSDGPINDPSMSFMLDLTWPDGRLTKEYSFLLDPQDVGRGSPRYNRTTPPVTQQNAQVDEQRVQPGVSQEVSGSRGRGRTVSTPAAKPDSKAESKAEDGAGGVGHTVRSGETLHSIARQYLPRGATLEQMVIALYSNNVTAFENGDADRLQVGAALRIPSSAEVRVLSREEARDMYRSAFSEHDAKPAARSRPRAQTQRADSAAAPSAQAKGKPSAHSAEIAAQEREIQRYDRRADKLEQDAERLRKQLAARDQSIAAAQEKLDKKRQETQSAADAKAKAAAEAKAKTAADAQAAEEARKAEASRRAEEERRLEDERKAAEARLAEESRRNEEERAAAEKARADEEARLKAEMEAEKVAPPVVPVEEPVEPESAGTTDTEEPLVEPPEVGEPPEIPPVEEAPPVPQVTPPPAQPALDSAEEDDGSVLLWAGGGAALLALLGGGFFFMRRRKTGGKEVSELSSGAPSEKPLSSLSGFSDEGLNSIFQVTTGQSVNTTNATTPPSELSQALPDNNNVGDEVDPVEEADVYMAYGRDAQAEELLLDALPKDPNRIAIRVKLLEIYANRKSRKEFETIAHEVLAQTGGQGSDWEKVAAMGVAFDPGNSLYGGKASGGFAPPPADDSFSMMPEEEESTGRSAQDTGITSTGFMATQPVARPDEKAADEDPLLQMLHEGAGKKPTDSDLDFDLDAMAKAEEELEAKSHTVSSPTSLTSTGGLSGVRTGGTSSKLDFSFDEEPAPPPPPPPPPPPKPVAPASTVSSGGALGASIDTTATTSATSTVVNPDVATIVNPDFAFTKTATRVEIEEGMSIPRLDLEDTPTLIPADDIEMAETSFINPSEMSDDVEFDVQLTESTILGDVAVPGLGDLGNIDLDLKAGASDSITQMTPEMESAADSILSSTGEIGAEESGDARRDEVNTKLDLAKVYEEMGDLEGARELLAEVAGEGDPDQIAQAEAALARLSG